MTPLLLLLILIVLLLLSATFSASEAALLAINKIRLRHLTQQGNTHARVAYSLVTRLDRLIATILIYANLINVLLSALATILCVQWFGPEWGIAAATVGMTILLLVVGEITPKVFAAAHAERMALAVAIPMARLITATAPVTRLFTAVSHGIIRLVGGQRLRRSPLITEEEIRLMIEVGKEEGVLGDDERKMLHRIFEFGDTLVGAVMIPRAQIIAVEVTAGVDELLERFVEEGHARLPVYRGDLDRIEGIIYARDLLHLLRHDQLVIVADLIHPAHLVPPSKRVTELLKDFQRLHLQIALVQDAKHRTVGLVTLEDLLEEIVGDMPRERRRTTSIGN